MTRGALVVLLALPAGCSIDNRLERRYFACANGGVCDASVPDVPHMPAPDAPHDDAAVRADTGDAGAGVIVDECDPIRQTGCPGATQRCIVENGVPGGGTRCVSDPGDSIALDGPCVGGDCAAGLVCVRVEADKSVCRQVCDPETGVGCEPLGIDYDCRAKLKDTNWGICTPLPPTCEPKTHVPCETYQACQPLRRRNGTFELRCGTAGTRVHGAPCNDTTRRCARDYVCVRVAAEATCYAVCATDPECPGRSACVGTISDLPIRYCYP